ncbi:hypothetical protein NDU88_006186, partial [Pleurodeles waltl]
CVSCEHGGAVKNGLIPRGVKNCISAKKTLSLELAGRTSWRNLSVDEARLRIGPVQPGGTKYLVYVKITRMKTTEEEIHGKSKQRFIGCALFKCKKNLMMKEMSVKIQNHDSIPRKGHDNPSFHNDENGTVNGKWERSK